MKTKHNKLIETYFINPNSKLSNKIQREIITYKDLVINDPLKAAIPLLLLYVAVVIWSILYYTVPALAIPIAALILMACVYRSIYNVYFIYTEFKKFRKYIKRNSI